MMLRQAVLPMRCFRNQAACALSTTSSARKDFVQDMYLKELRAYKTPPPVKDAHVGVVKPFSAPPIPKAPKLPSDIAAELSKYDDDVPTLAEATIMVTLAAREDEETSGGAKEFLAFLEKDKPKRVHHH